MMSATLVKTRRKIKSEKKRLRAISPHTTAKFYSVFAAGFVTESVL
jgi:hypothetical protein